MQIFTHFFFQKCALLCFLQSGVYKIGVFFRRFASGCANKKCCEWAFLKNRKSAISIRTYILSHIGQNAKSRSYIIDIHRVTRKITGANGHKVKNAKIHKTIRTKPYFSPKMPVFHVFHSKNSKSIQKLYNATNRVNCFISSS